MVAVAESRRYERIDRAPQLPLLLKVSTRRKVSNNIDAPRPTGSRIRMGGGVDDRDGLENRFTSNRNVGSNPTPSAFDLGVDRREWNRLSPSEFHFLGS